MIQVDPATDHGHMTKRVHSDGSWNGHAAVLWEVTGLETPKADDIERWQDMHDEHMTTLIMNQHQINV